MRLVLGNVARLVAAGAAIGLVLSLFATKFVTTLLFGLSPGDPMTFVFSTILLAVVSLAAGWIPAYRASRVDVAALLNRG
jgi:ABC-type antimicrobial peptide transport system permease subunit